MDKKTNILNSYLYRYSSVFYLLCDDQGKIIETNHFTGKLIGYDPTGIEITKVFVDFTQQLDIHKLADSQEEHLLNVTTLTGLPQSLYFKFYTFDDYVIILGRYDYIQDEQLRKEIITLNNDLNSLTRKLYKQKSQLEKLNRLKDQFLGMAAHDLRKPISIIISYTEFLQEDLEGKLEPEHDTFLKKITQSSFFMSKIINDFLDVALIEAGKFKLDLSENDITKLIKENISQHQILAKKDKVSILLKGNPQPIFLSFDHSKIEQVLNNLIGNAIEHSPSHTTVTVSISQDENCVTVAVSDQGKGISSEKQKEIFDIFAKDKRKLRSKKSIGLGLAISRKIIESHQGTIQVDSVVNEGSTFSFCLPQKRGD